jgi:hypothetical protein
VGWLGLEVLSTAMGWWLAKGAWWRTPQVKSDGAGCAFAVPVIAGHTRAAVSAPKVIQRRDVVMV